MLVYLPLICLALAGWAVVSTDRWRLAIEAEVAEVVEQVAARPEFTVKGVTIEGAGPELETVLRALVGPVTGQSSLRLDLDRVRREIEGMGEVASAALYFDAAGTLAIRIVERVPTGLWRDPEGSLWVIDREGVLISRAAKRIQHPTLPLLLGVGAPARIEEIGRIAAAAPSLVERVRGYALVGERRWDVVLDRGLVIRLPEEGPERALAGAMALQFGEELFDRDLVVVDLRVPARPALRLAPRSAEEMVLRRAVDLVMGEDT